MRTTSLSLPRQVDAAWLERRWATLKKALLPAAVMLALWGACLAKAESSAPIAVQDDHGVWVRLTAPAERIVSLAPHATENLFAIGAGKSVVAAVEYSDFPPEAKDLPRVGGYTRIDLEAVLAARPHLIIAWPSGNPKAALEKLEAFGIPIFRSDPDTPEAIADNLERLGVLVGRSQQALEVAAALRARFAALRQSAAGKRSVRVFYQVWHQPLRTVGAKSVITQVIELCGGANVFGHMQVPAPVVSVEDVLAANPEVIIAGGMSEHQPAWLEFWRAWPQIEAVRRGQLVFIPPELLQRPTPRLAEGAERLCMVLQAARQNP